jgi:hypothetical protein
MFSDGQQNSRLSCHLKVCFGVQKKWFKLKFFRTVQQLMYIITENCFVMIWYDTIRYYTILYYIILYYIIILLHDIACPYLTKVVLTKVDRGKILVLLECLYGYSWNVANKSWRTWPSQLLCHKSLPTVIATLQPLKLLKYGQVTISSHVINPSHC